jgi:hypothetical protein
MMGSAATVIAFKEVADYRDHFGTPNMRDDTSIDVDYIKSDSFELENFLMGSIEDASDKLARERRASFHVVK